jgi:hypothetical protein
MTRQVTRQFCRLGEVHSLVYGRRASGENGRKLTASTRVGLESRLTDYLGLINKRIQRSRRQGCCAGLLITIRKIFAIPISVFLNSSFN